jgi:hypothetical protein
MSCDLSKKFGKDNPEGTFIWIKQNILKYVFISLNKKKNPHIILHLKHTQNAWVFLENVKKLGANSCILSVFEM